MFCEFVRLLWAKLKTHLDLSVDGQQNAKVIAAPVSEIGMLPLTV